MPEEVNRVLTDRIADLLLTPSQDADRNLLAEGIEPRRIRLVGNVMIDSLFKQLGHTEGSKVRERLGLVDREYAVMTLHRPSNVDDATTLSQILAAVGRVGRRLPVIFPVHPRTRARMEEFGLLGRPEEMNGLRLVEPLGYLDFLRLYSGAQLVLTDSGGIQEETTALGVPCLTLRENTERPITVEMGTNVVVGTDPTRIIEAAEVALERKRAGTEMCVPPLWDGHAAERIVEALASFRGAADGRT
jgi:UDP-N-acetylglucosamine 2-epimerase (non-hydrolysing)